MGFFLNFFFIDSKFLSNICKYNLPRVTMMRVGNGVLLVFSVKERLTEHTKMYGFYIQKYSFHILIKDLYDFYYLPMTHFINTKYSVPVMLN